jgi:two-component system LytT family response regulator
MRPPGVFLRLDRSLAINMQRLLATQTRSRDQPLLTFEGLDEPLPIGRTAASRLKDTLRV